MKKRIISSVMCLAMLLSLLPVSAFAAGQFTLTYNENKPAGASAVQVENFPDPATVTADDTEMVTKPETDPTLEGYVFGGWFTDADCTSGNEVDFDSPLSADVTAYAKWTEAIMVTFDGNKPSGATADVAGLPGAVAAGADGKVTEPETAPTLEGYTFGGWYKEAACTTLFDFDTDTVEEATTLYAKWIALAQAEVVSPSQKNGHKK